MLRAVIGNWESELRYSAVQPRRVVALSRPCRRSAPICAYPAVSDPEGWPANRSATRILSAWLAPVEAPSSSGREERMRTNEAGESL
jgi:hypothetical protein